MNTGHAALCSSPEWAAHIAATVLPRALAGLDLGETVLEIGPGYGASTTQLASTVHGPAGLTVLEVDDVLAAGLAERFPSVRVVHGSGDRLPFDDGTFSAVVCFTMLHHVASTQMQDAMFAEVRRVLRPGGTFAGSDSIANDGLHAFHGDDTYVPVDPAALPSRLTTAGFTGVEVRVAVPDEWFTFRAHREETSS